MMRNHSTHSHMLFPAGNEIGNKGIDMDLRICRRVDKICRVCIRDDVQIWFRWLARRDENFYSIALSELYFASKSHSQTSLIRILFDPGFSKFSSGSGISFFL